MLPPISVQHIGHLGQDKVQELKPSQFLSESCIRKFGSGVTVTSMAYLQYESYYVYHKDKNDIKTR